jgi:hypothetical protein
VELISAAVADFSAFLTAFSCFGKNKNKNKIVNSDEMY